MTRSIFDPDGGQTERSGSTHLGPRGDNNSHMPPDVVDGEVSEEEVADAQALAAAEDQKLSPAERLEMLEERRDVPPELGADGQSQRPA